MLFVQLSIINFNIVNNEHAKLQLQNLLDSYDQFIIDITNNSIGKYLHFENVGKVIIRIQTKK